MKIIYDNIIFSLQKAGGISVVWYELCYRLLRDKVRNMLFIEKKDISSNIFRKILSIPS